MNYLDTLLADPENAKIYAQESFINETLERICERMEEQGVSRAELARRLRTSRSNITQLLSGRNLSLRMIAAVAAALDLEPELRFTPRSVPTKVVGKLSLHLPPMPGFGVDDGSMTATSKEE